MDDIIPYPDQRLQEIIEKKKVKIGFSAKNAWALFLLFIIAYVVVDSWSHAGQSFIQQTFHGGLEMNWKFRLMYAVIFTIFFIILLFVTKIPLATFETV